MDAAEAGETRIFQTRNLFENICLRAVLHFGLKADDVVKRAKLVVAAQLHHGMGFDVRLVWIGQANRFHRAVAQGLATALGHDFDGQAAVKIARGFAFAELGLVGLKQRVDKIVVLLLVHRAVEVGGALFLGFALVIARLHPGFGHVDAVEIDDGGNSVEEGQCFGPGLGSDGFGQRAGSQRAGGDDPFAVFWQFGDLAVFNGDIGVREQRVGDGLREGITVHRQRTARGQAVFVGAGHDQAVGGTHFPMQQAHGVLLVIIRAEGVGADHLAQKPGLVGEGFDLGAHFVDDHRDACVRRLPSRF
ncbi:hypothetical protein XMM354_003355 [Aliiroseovarius sp. xm-m-354]|nr:hypothetical protein [Aliiroseovarius sp. xm-m-354]